jgi:hypothetical protein
MTDIVATLKMAGDATTLPLRGAPLGDPRAGRGRGSLSGRARELARAPSATWIGALALSAILLLSVLLVVMAADRPSGLSPTTHANYFPRWMAGPLGGLWPGMPGDSNTIRYMFTAGLALMFISYLMLLRNLSAVPARWVVAAIIGAHAIFVLAPPMALTDVFNYINYGRMEVVHHLNPYTTIPIVEPHSDPSFMLSNWHQLLSPYGPLFTMLTFAVVPLGVAGSFWALKTILALASLATLLLVWRCARLLGRDPRAAIALVGLNPIVLVWGLGGDHNDFLMLFCIVLGFYLLLLARGRAAASDVAQGDWRHWLYPLSALELGAGAAFVTAAAFKASGAILIPVVLAGVLRSRRTLAQLVIGIVAAGAVLGVASLIAFGLHIPDLSTQSRLVTSESIPNLIGLAVGAGGETQTLHLLMNVALAVAVILCCRLAYRRQDPITACGWASVALLVSLSWVLPWYVLWALPLAALSGSRRLRNATVVLGVYLMIVWAPASGLLWQAIGFHPERTALGRLHQRYVRELLH